MTRATSARLTGFAYLGYMAVGLSNDFLMARATAGEGTSAKLAMMAQHATDVRIGILLKVCECLAAFVLAVSLYGLTRDEDHELAVLAMVCRVAEGIFLASLIPVDLGLLWLSTRAGNGGVPDVAAAGTLAAFLFRPEGSIPAVFFALGSAIFSWLLLRGRM